MSAAPASSRRACLSGAAILGAAIGGASSCGPVVAAAAAADAKLLAPCDRALALDAELNRLLELHWAAEAAGDKELERDCFDRQVEMVPDLHAAWAEIAALTPARTEAGKRAKACVMLTRVEYDLDGTPCAEYALAYSICQDILAGSAAGVPVEPERAASLVADVLALVEGAA